MNLETRLPHGFHGLHANVDVDFDEWGIPRIQADNPEDLFFAQGYVTAEHRLPQMDLNRRLASGRVAELRGEEWLASDLDARRFGIAAAVPGIVRLLDEESLRDLKAYARGVNAWTHEHSDRLPEFYTEKGLSPAPWTVEDSLAVSRLLAWRLSGALDWKIQTVEMTAKLGEEAVVELLSPADPTTILQEFNTGRPRVAPHDSTPAFTGPSVDHDLFGLVSDCWRTGYGGSNNWVVGRGKSDTGHAMLCSDPHLLITDPPVWYEAHLLHKRHGDLGPLNVTGVTFPGLPGVLLGHNEHIAWGATNCAVDVTDLYQERINPKDGREYLRWGRYARFHITRETFQVLVSSEESSVPRFRDVDMEIWWTCHGPLLSPPQDNQAISFRWMGHGFSREVRAFRRIDYARNLQEFREALNLFDFAVPAQNFVYADVVGNIAYQVAGRVPLRKCDPSIIYEGWSGEQEWSGNLPFEELPRCINPPEGFIATANNQPVPDSYPYYLSTNWDSGYRAHRIGNLLCVEERLTFEDLQSVQNDRYSLQAEQFVPVLLRLEAADPDVRSAQEALRGWDCRLTVDSPAPSILFAWMRYVCRLVLRERLGLPLYLTVGSQDRFVSRVADLVVNHPESVLLRDVEDRNRVMLQGLQQALAWLREGFGPSAQDWAWGKVHVLLIQNPLDPLRPRGPFPRDSGPNCVDVASMSFLEDHFISRGGATMRMVVEMSPEIRSEMAVPGRQGLEGAGPSSGKDQLELWRNHQYRKMRFSKSG